jgi:hypothetical protein
MAAMSASMWRNVINGISSSWRINGGCRGWHRRINNGAGASYGMAGIGVMAIMANLVSMSAWPMAKANLA